MLLPEGLGPVSATLQCKSKVCGVCAACRKELKEAARVDLDVVVPVVQSDLVRQILAEPRPKKLRPKVRAVQNRRKKEPT